MESSTLKLVFLKGARQGETLEFRSGTSVRIGRVMRGNNVAIRDPGISSQHLVIEFESGKWLLKDIGSSNGTGLNSTPISPFEPVELRENDTINVGEKTSLCVHIEADLASSYGRGKRTRGRAKVAVSTSQDDDLNKEESSKSNARASRGRKVATSDGTKTSGKAKRRKRNEKVLPLETVNEEEEDEKEANPEAEPIVNEEEENVKEANPEAEPIMNVVTVKEEMEYFEEEQPQERNTGSNWEKLTLGEWFDYMEDFVRKQVVEMSETVIAEMKQKAERVCEYRVETMMNKECVLR